MSDFLVRSDQCLWCMDHGGEVIPIHRSCLDALEEEVKHLREELHDAKEFMAEEAQRAHSLAAQAAFEAYEAGRTDGSRTP